MDSNHYVGQRLSYSGQTCTVRYTGPVKGTKGDWLGVEWDDPSRGKHDGSHDRIRYFTCLSKQPVAGSFVRSSRATDAPLSFTEALKKKYASGGQPGVQAALEETISISGKVVEERGFEKIQKQLANLQKLQIVILDGLCIRNTGNDRDFGHPTCSKIGPSSLEGNHGAHLGDMKIAELDLSRNLLETWEEVSQICAPFNYLRTLKLDGNRFRSISRLANQKYTFGGLKELSLDSTLLSWDEIVSLSSTLVSTTSPLHGSSQNTLASSLRNFSLSTNNLAILERPLSLPTLHALDLSFNSLTSLDSFGSLSSLTNLTSLSLRGNPLETLTSDSQQKIVFPALRYLDISTTLLPSLASLNPISATFPNLTTILTKDTPLAKTPSSNLYTIGRLATIKELNYQPITPTERQNAEIYYLNAVAKQLSTSPNPNTETDILISHPRWSELCTIYGKPDIVKAPLNEAAAGTLGARIVDFLFYLATSPTATKRARIPNTIDTYHLHAIVGRLFDLRVAGWRLVLETGELDPVPGREEEEGWSVSEDEEEGDGGEYEVRAKRESGEMMAGKEGKGIDWTKWMRREVKLVRGTRAVRNFVEGREARVRVEMGG